MKSRVGEWVQNALMGVGILVLALCFYGMLPR